MAGGTPTEVSAVLSDLLTAEQQAFEIVAGLSHGQANWQPVRGRSWSIVQCLSHLARVNRLYAVAMYEAASRTDANGAGPSTQISPGWFGGWFIRSMEPPVRKKMKSPRKAIPISQSDPAEAVAEFVESHEPVRGVIEVASLLDLNRVRFKNPFVPLLRFTIGTGLLIINGHDRRHLWQASRVKEALGFPPR
jgi:DinB superfamily